MWRAGLCCGNHPCSAGCCLCVRRSLVLKSQGWEVDMAGVWKSIGQLDRSFMNFPEVDELQVAAGAKRSELTGNPEMSRH